MRETQEHPSGVWNLPLTLQLAPTQEHEKTPRYTPKPFQTPPRPHLTAVLSNKSWQTAATDPLEDVQQTPPRHPELDKTCRVSKSFTSPPRPSGRMAGTRSILGVTWSCCGIHRPFTAASKGEKKGKGSLLHLHGT